MAGHPAHASRRRIVDYASKQRQAVGAARRAGRGAALGRGDARPHGGRRVERRVLHPERLEDALAGELIQRLPAHARDDVAEEEEVDVAVDEPLTGQRGRNLLDGALDRGVVPEPLVGHVDVGPEAGDVGEQVPDGDVALAVACELRDEGRDPVGEAKATVLDERRHAGRRGDHLGDRRHVEDGVGGHRLDRRLERPLAEALEVQRAVTATDQDDRPRHLAGLNRLFDELVDEAEASGLRLRRRRPQCGRRSRRGLWLSQCDRRGEQHHRGDRSRAQHVGTGWRYSGSSHTSLHDRGRER